jgi:quercetin dioxygenase-like cupin family protein
MMMNKFQLNTFTRGWFVGAFKPSLFDTDQVEVAVQKFSAGATEPRHCHKIATEITVIVKGRVKMNGEIIGEGEIVVIEPGSYTDFYAIEDTITTVVKIPGALNDKYVDETISQ